MSTAQFPEILKSSRPLRIGFIPDSDCAPIIVAHESGLFEKYELKVELQRETRWAGIRDRIVYGELDAAHAPATLPFITNLEIDSDQSACLAGMVLSLQGSAITISQELWHQGVRDGASLRDIIYRDWGRRTYTFAVEFPHSPPYFVLRQWLKFGGVLPHTELRIVTVSPAQMYPTLKLGYIDGFCVGEPWTSLAVESQVGACVATSAELAPLHPEKVLMTRRSFTQDHASEHERMIAALIEACAFCDEPQNYPVLAELLAQPKYVNAPVECLKRSLAGPPVGDSTSTFHPAGSTIFYRNNANDPTNAKSTWLVNRLYELMEQSVLKIPPSRRTPVLKNIFRHDLYERGKTALNEQALAIKAEAEKYKAENRQLG
jgi:ABC-type nitrate/sulfonate/bicarbonate transport system substrate-binding protein